MLDIEQIDTAVPDADLRITVTAFVPAAQGPYDERRTSSTSS